jgi:hypothetical protein
VVDERGSEQLLARYLTDERTISLSALSSGPFAGDVVIGAGQVTLDLHYDFEARQIIADGHDGALDRHSHGLLRDAAESVAGNLEPTRGAPGALPLHEQMLSAGLVLLEEAGGMPLSRIVFQLDEPAGSGGREPAAGASGRATIDKSLGDDGVRCVERGSTHAVSFDDLSGTTADRPVTTDVDDCNGKCGPGCSSLTPWAMWTLDCLEHDTCCGATEDIACWTPLGQCGNEYVDAERDFLRGFDPFSSHCGG